MLSYSYVILDRSINENLYSFTFIYYNMYKINKNKEEI